MTLNLHIKQNKQFFLSKIWLIFIIFSWLFVSRVAVLEAATTVELENIEIFTYPDKTDIVLTLSKPTKYSISKLDAPPRLLVDFKADVESKFPKKQRIGKGKIEYIRSYYLLPSSEDDDILVPLDAIVLEFTEIDLYESEVKGNTIVITVHFRTAYSTALGEEKAGQQSVEVEELTESIEKQKQEEKQNLLASGRSAYRAKDFEGALKAWREALKLDPSDSKIEAYIRRAEARMTQLELEKEPLEKKDKKDLNTLEDQKKYYLNQGKQFFRKKEYGQAIKAWEMVGKLDPKDPKAVRYIKKAEERIAEDKAKKIKDDIKKKEKGEVLSEETSVELPDTLPDILAEEYEKSRTEFSELSLKECIDIALKNDTELKVAQEEVVLAYLKSEDARKGLLPKASLKWNETLGTTSGQQYRGREFTFELQQPLFDGSKLENTYRQAKVNIVVSEKNYEKQKNDFLFEIENAYYVLANSQKILSNLHNGLNRAKESLALMEKRMELDLSKPIDMLTVKTSYNDMYLKVATAINDLELAQLSLKQKMGLNPTASISVVNISGVENVLEISYGEALELAYENRADLQVNELMVLYHLYAIKMAKGARRYKVDLMATGGLNDEAYTTDPLKLESEWYVGLKVSRPLGVNVIENSTISQDKVPAAGQTTSSRYTNNSFMFKFFQNQVETSIAEATVAYHKAIKDYDKAKNTIYYEIQEGIFNYKKALLKMANARSSMALTRKELEINKLKASLDEVTPPEILKMELRLYDQITEFEQSVTDYYTQIAKLNKLIGISRYFDPINVRKNVKWSKTKIVPQKDIEEKKWWEVWKKTEEDAITDIVEDYYELDSEFDKFYPLEEEEKRPEYSFWKFWSRDKKWDKDVFPVKKIEELPEEGDQGFLDKLRFKKTKRDKEGFKDHYIEKIKSYRLLQEESDYLEQKQDKELERKKKWWKKWKRSTKKEDYLELDDFYPIEAQSRILIPEDDQKGEKWWKFWTQEEELQMYLPDERPGEEMILPEEDEKLGSEVNALIQDVEKRKGANLTDFIVEETNEEIRLIFTTSNQIYFKYYELDNPVRLIISFDSVVGGIVNNNITVGRDGVNQVRFRYLSGNVLAAVIIDLEYPIAYKVYADETRLVVIFKKNIDIL